MADDCLFCKIVAGDIPSEKVYETENVFAFRDINPGAPTHVLVIPKRHIARMIDAEPEDAALLGELFLAANEVARLEGIDQRGVRYVVNTNKDAGQLVFHIHLHVIGGRELSWPPG